MKFPISGLPSNASVLMKILAFLFLFLVIEKLYSFSHLCLQASEIRSYYESLEESDERFMPAVEELMKITYAEQDWRSFFAYAQYYRIKGIESDTYLLELLALLRHCQNQVLEELIQSYRKNKDRPEYDQILSLSHTVFKGKKVNTQPSYELKSRSQGDALWKINSKWIGRQHPSKIKIKVKNLCQ